MPSRMLSDCVPALQEGWCMGLQRYRQSHPGRDLQITCTYRSPEEQAALWAQGRTLPGHIVTDCDGVKIKSKHNAHPALALDFCVLIGGKVSWAESDYDDAGACFKAEGLRWGIKLKNGVIDHPHIEVM